MTIAALSRRAEILWPRPGGRCWTRACLPVLLLAACTLAPEYSQPEIAVPDGLSPAVLTEGETPQETGAAAPAPSCSLKLSPIEGVFSGNDRLHALLERTRTENGEVRIAQARLKQAQARRSASFANLFPPLSFSQERTRTSLFKENDLLFPKAQLSTSHTAGVGVTGYEADVWGKLRSLDEAERQAALSQEAYVRATLVSVEMEVVLAWHDLAASAAMRQTLLEHQALLERNGAQIDRLMQEGVLLQTDPLWRQNLTDQADVQDNLQKIEEALNDSHMRLYLLTGDSSLLTQRLTRPGDLPAFVMPQLHQPIAASSILARPDIARAEALIRRANGNIGAARAAFLPVVNITGRFGNSTDDFDKLLQDWSDNWSLTGALTAPIFAFGRNRARLRQAWAEQEELVIEYQQTVAGAFREVQEALDRIALAQKREEEATALLSRQVELLERADRRRAAGYLSELELLQIRMEQTSFRIAQIRSRRDMGAGVARLYGALGGALCL